MGKDVYWSCIDYLCEVGGGEVVVVGICWFCFWKFYWDGVMGRSWEYSGFYVGIGEDWVWGEEVEDVESYGWEFVWWCCGRGWWCVYM